jgi:hypothetical protein
MESSKGIPSQTQAQAKGKGKMAEREFEKPCLLGKKKT